MKKLNKTKQLGAASRNTKSQVLERHENPNKSCSILPANMNVLHGVTGEDSTMGSTVPDTDHQLFNGGEPRHSIAGEELRSTLTHTFGPVQARTKNMSQYASTDKLKESDVPSRYLFQGQSKFISNCASTKNL